MEAETKVVNKVWIHGSKPSTGESSSALGRKQRMAKLIMEDE
jgi:hypothetical protein